MFIVLFWAVLYVRIWQLEWLRIIVDNQHDSIDSVRLVWMISVSAISPTLSPVGVRASRNSFKILVWARVIAAFSALLGSSACACLIYRQGIHQLDILQQEMIIGSDFIPTFARAKILPSNAFFRSLCSRRSIMYVNSFFVFFFNFLFLERTGEGRGGGEWRSWKNVRKWRGEREREKDQLEHMRSRLHPIMTAFFIYYCERSGVNGFLDGADLTDQFHWQKLMRRKI